MIKKFGINMEPIQLIGTRYLDDMEADAVKRLCSRYYPKIKRELKNNISLVIHIKKYKKYDHVRDYGKYSVHVRVIAPTRIFTSTKGHDWHINAALHKSFDNILHQLHHSLYTEDQHRRAFV